MKKTIISLVFTILFFSAYTQETAKNNKFQSYFANENIIDITFHVDSKDIVNNDLTNFMSITNVKKSANGNGFDVFARASLTDLTEFSKRNIPFVVVEKSIDTKAYSMATTTAQMASWNRYPTYSVYEQMMADFASTYPTLCNIDTIMSSTPSGNYRILVARISDNVNTVENEPQFLYSSTIHGDETTGFYLMLRLINYLLSNYGTNSQVTNLVNNVEIWICPDANPEGTYYNSNPIGSTVVNSRRENLAGIDLNRNYPDPRAGNNPDGNATQPETQAFMNFASAHHFSMGANFHGGAELLNYPWDTWTTSGNPNADAPWWERACKNYVDTARLITPTYMNSTFADGVSEGGDWYVITGGRQDYMNWFHHCREVTIELDLTKLTQTQNLNQKWNENYKSLLNYLQESLYGVRGIVTDACSGLPINAKVWVNSYDQINDSSQVYSHLPLGNYFKFINQGTYQITFSAPGYQSKTVNNVSVANYAATILNVQLTPNTAPDAQFAYAINNHTVNFTNNSTNATSYLWKFGDGATSTLANPSHTYASLGNQVVTLLAYKQNCTDSIVSSLLLTSVNESDAQFLSQFTIPNPIKDQLIIRVNNSLQNPILIKLVSIDGSIVYDGKLSDQSFSYDMSKLSGGIYLLKLESETHSGVMKLIKL